MTEGKVSGLSWPDLIKDPSKITVKMFWEIFVKQVYPKVVEGSAQYVHQRRCFYCGFLECQKFYMDISCDLPEDKATELVGKIMDETNEFFDKELSELIPKRDPNKLMG